MAMDDAQERDGRADPHGLSSPRIFVLSMLLSLGFVVVAALVLQRQIASAFYTNPGLNGLILVVLGVGLLLTFGQVWRLVREVRWVNSFRRGEETDPRRAPQLLAPMRALLTRTQATALSTSSLRSILDSIATRLDEQRDTTRYLIGLLVFLGLLGTFWGLLGTIGSIGTTIQGLNPSSGSTGDVLDALKTGLSRPLEGMGTAFSSSLFGLAGSLVLGLFDLQASRAQNRFYTELENWLASVTDVNSDMGFASGVRSSEDDMREMAERMTQLAQDGGANPRATAAMANLAEGVQGLVKNMRAEQQMMRDWVEAQASEQRRLRLTLDRLTDVVDDRLRERDRAQSYRPMVPREADYPASAHDLRQDPRYDRRQSDPRQDVRQDAVRQDVRPDTRQDFRQDVHQPPRQDTRLQPEPAQPADPRNVARIVGERG